MFRGIEHILRGRDPRDAWLFAQRVCGTCTGVHALASVRAVENALGVDDPAERPPGPQPPRGDAVRRGPRRPLLPPPGARLGRRRGGPRRGSRGDRRPSPGRSATGRSRARAYFAEVQDRLAALVAVRPARARSPTATGATPPTRLPPEANLARRRPLPRGARLAAPVHADPHAARRQEPAPADLPRRRDGPRAAVGRARPRACPASTPQQIERNAPAALSDARPRRDRRPHRRGADVRRAGLRPRRPAGRPGLPGLGGDRRPAIGNYLSFGEFPEDDTAEPALLLPRGRVMGRDLGARGAGRPGRRRRDGRPARTTPTTPATARPSASVGRRRRSRATAGPPPPVTTLEGAEQVQLAQGAALRRRADGGRAAGPGARRLRRGPRRRPGRRRPRRRRRSASGRRRSSARSAGLVARAIEAAGRSPPGSASWHARARPRNLADRRPRRRRRHGAGIPARGRRRPAAGRSARRRAAPSATG